MRGFQFVPLNTTIDFVGKRYVNYFISLTVVVLTLASVAWHGLNYGIDFKGGILLEVKTPGPAQLDMLRKDLGTLRLGEISLQDFGAPDEVLIRIERQKGGEDAQQATVEKVKEKLGQGVSFRRIEMVGPKVGATLIHNGVLAVLWALGAMFVYVWVRYEWQFALCGIISLIHDAIGVLGYYAVLGFEFNTTALVALLITISYSINDTVVVYDRIRENMRKYKVTDMKVVINKSINETLSRTILTSATTLLSLLALYFFGGEMIATYTLPIIVGVAMGTYSSICIAAPLLCALPKIRRGEEQNVKTPATA